MTYVEIPMDEQLLAEIDEAGKRLGLSRAQMIKDALLAWLQQREGQRFEQGWIAALAENPHDASRAEDWLGAQTWTES